MFEIVKDRNEARELIGEILKDNGFVPPSIMATLDEEPRNAIEQALLAKDKKIASSVLTLAKNLYTSQARFIFELLQNADDNQYTRGQDPYVIFRIYPNRIVVECNEDGFTRQNLFAICDIGKSSKTAAHGYIGEKGIGFKSVFMAAWKVHIQSGHFSFEFIHRKNDSGMGMVTPIWQETRDADLSFDVTRITLYLHEHNDPFESARHRNIINEEFRELQDTLLLFLKKLRKIEVNFYGEEGYRTGGTTFTIQKDRQSRSAVIERKCTDWTRNKRRTYHLVKHMATGLARSENRELSEGEEVSKSFETSEVILAFPLTDSTSTNFSTPIIEPQDIFAFLPVRCASFNVSATFVQCDALCMLTPKQFLIQADFVTTANRQDISMTSLRDQGLIEAVADAFVAGVSQLCEHPTLQYQWMRFLPIEGVHFWDGLWRSLVSKIKYRVGEMVVFRSLELSSRKLIKNLYFRPEFINDKHGAPLFADVRPELYLSDLYKSSDIDILKNFGLEPVDWPQILELVSHDLRAISGQSRIRSSVAIDQWQTRVYELFNRVWKQDFSLSRCDPIECLKALDIIPLQDGSWVSSNSGNIYFPRYGNVEVPQDLGFRLLSPQATDNTSRSKFFDNLGVQRIDIDMVSEVRGLILQQPPVPSTIDTLDTSVCRMRFLFLTQHLFPGKPPYAGKFMIYDHEEIPRNPNVTDMYISNNDPYGAEIFLRQKGRQVSCVNPRYFENIPPNPPNSGIAISTFMNSCLGVRSRLRLLSRDRRAFSAECLDTARTRPKEFLEFLVHLLPFEQNFVMKDQRLLSILRNTEVICMNETMEPLSRTYLPQKPLLDTYERFMMGEYFPFLYPSSVQSLSTEPWIWTFLPKFLHVKNRDDVDYRLDLLYYFARANLDASMIENRSHLLELYQSIAAQLNLSQDRETDERKVRQKISSLKLLYVPAWNYNPSTWQNPSQCLWDAPSNFVTKPALKHIYASVFPNLGADINFVDFCCNKLRIRDVNASDVVVELEELKYRQEARNDTIQPLYRMLEDTLDNTTNLRSLFEAKALIYFDNNGSPGWYKPSDCVWTDMAEIHGKIAVNKQYSELREFFIRGLEIPRLNLEMVYDQLLQSKALKFSAEYVKGLLKTLNSFLRIDSNPPNPTRLLKAHIFPIKQPGSAEVTLTTFKTEFVIVDREGSSGGFKDKVRILDLTLQEIRSLEPLLSWMDLGSRYMSKNMQETSHVGNGVHTPITCQHRDVQRKANALLRIAAAFNSPRYEVDHIGLHETLRTAKTLKSETISSSLSLKQDGMTHEIAIGQSELHIEDSSSLIIYVPSGTTSQECCFMFNLPHRLSSWIMTHPLTGHLGKVKAELINVIKSILNCHLATVETILEKEGIPELPEAIRASLPPSEVHDMVENTAEAYRAIPDICIVNKSPPETPTRSLGHTGPFSPDSAPATCSSMPETNILDYPTPLTDIEDYEDADYTSNMNYGNINRPLKFSITTSQSQLQYRRLLESIVALARRTTLQSASGPGLAEISSLSTDNDPFSGFQYVHDANDWLHKQRIGAAGELFVFSMLSNTRDLDFDLHNWRSRLRKHAKVLPEYKHIEAWTGQETSDIVYDDSKSGGALTRIMVSLGYLDERNWLGKVPQYYIEVKSTMGDCVTPYAVSQNQVNLMENTTNGPHGDQNQNTIYALFRVFNLGKNSMGLKIYIDPWEQRRVGKLNFTVEKYSVAPVGDRSEVPEIIC